ncbi:hypothetical protein R6Z07F_012839 [Ovis aries]
MALLSSRSQFPWWLTTAADTVVKGQNGQLGTPRGTSRVKCVWGAERESQTAGTGDFPAEGEAAARGSAGHPVASVGTWARGVVRTRRQPPAGHAADPPRPPPGLTTNSELGTWDLCCDRVSWRPREKSRVDPERRVDCTALERRYRPVSRGRKPRNPHPQGSCAATQLRADSQAPVRTMQAGFSRAPQGARMATQPAFCGPPRTTASS